MSEPKNPWIATGEVFSIGILIPLSVLIGYGLGHWLDGRFRTGPWLTFVFTLIGLASGLYETVRILIRAARG